MTDEFVTQLRTILNILILLSFVSPVLKGAIYGGRRTFARAVAFLGAAFLSPVLYTPISAYVSTKLKTVPELANAIGPTSISAGGYQLDILGLVIRIISFAVAAAIVYTIVCAATAGFYFSPVLLVQDHVLGIVMGFISQAFKIMVILMVIKPVLRWLKLDAVYTFLLSIPVIGVIQHMNILSVLMDAMDKIIQYIHL